MDEPHGEESERDSGKGGREQDREFAGKKEQGAWKESRRRENKWPDGKDELGWRWRWRWGMGNVVSSSAGGRGERESRDGRR